MQLISVPIIPAHTDAQWERQAPASFYSKKLLVITTPFLKESPEEITLLRMMKACKLESSDYALLHFDENNPISWAGLQSAGLPKVLLLLGITPAALAIRALFKFGAANQFSGIQLIPSLSLTELNQDAAAKRKLWDEGLKPALRL